MGSRTDRIEILFMLAVAIMIFVFLIYLIGLSFLAFVLAAIVISVIAERLLRYYERRNQEDERLVKISAFACMNAFIGTLVIGLAMNLMYSMHMLPSYTVQEAIVIFGFIMFLLFAIWLTYYYLKGDVE